MGLVVAGEEWGGSGHIAPLGETKTPPLVVFGDGVKLGKVKGEFWFSHLLLSGFSLLHCQFRCDIRTGLTSVELTPFG